MSQDGHQSSDPGLAPHSFFVPMVDLLAGVVFLLVIMLAASVLVTRADFGQAQAMQAELQRISAELEAARTAERLLLDPRRQADRDRRLMLERIATLIASQGYAVDIDPEAGALSVTGHGTFGAAAAPGEAGEELARVVGDALARELPCLVPPDANAANCDGYGSSRLETVSVTATAPGASPDPSQAARVRSLRLFSQMASHQPGLLGLAGADGLPIMTYGAAITHQQAGGGEALVVQFQMSLPPLP